MTLNERAAIEKLMEMIGQLSSVLQASIGWSCYCDIQSGLVEANRLMNADNEQ